MPTPEAPGSQETPDKPSGEISGQRAGSSAASAFSIIVTPGNATVAKNGDQLVAATLNGFTAEQAGHRGRLALVGQMQHLRADDAGKKLGTQMIHVAAAGRCITHGLRFGLGERDEIFYRVARE